MSANSGGLGKGMKVYHNGNPKTVKSWYFISPPDGGPHNSDIIVIEFKDGTDTDEEGFSKIRFLDEKPKDKSKIGKWSPEAEAKFKKIFK